MPNVINSPNMSLPVPVVGTDTGPDWANNLNSCLGILDQHDHSPGRGVQVTTTGININTDFTINSNSLLSVKSLVFTAQSGTLTSLGSLYVNGNELYYNDESGNKIKITTNGSVNAGAGSISGLPSGTAGVSYSSGNQTFVFDSATNTPANIDGGSVIIREIATAAKGVTLSSVPSLAADYTLIMPAALPAASGSAVVCDTSGNLSFAPFASVSGSVVGPGGFSTIAAAIAATSAGGYITVTTGTYTENITLSKNLTIVGQGFGTVLNGTWTFATGSDDSLVSQLKFNSTVTLDSGVTEVAVVNAWLVGGTAAWVDNGTGNFFQGMGS